MAVYTTYMPLIYCQLGDYKGTRKQPLISHRCPSKGRDGFMADMWKEERWHRPDLERTLGPWRWHRCCEFWVPKKRFVICKATMGFEGVLCWFTIAGNCLDFIWSLYTYHFAVFMPSDSCSCDAPLTLFTTEILWRLEWNTESEAAFIQRFTYQPCQLAYGLPLDHDDRPDNDQAICAAQTKAVCTRYKMISIVKLPSEWFFVPRWSTASSIGRRNVSWILPANWKPLTIDKKNWQIQFNETFHKIGRRVKDSFLRFVPLYQNEFSFIFTGQKGEQLYIQDLGGQMTVDFHMPFSRYFEQNFECPAHE